MSIISHLSQREVYILKHKWLYVLLLYFGEKGIQTGGEVKQNNG